MTFFNEDDNFNEDVNDDAHFDGVVHLVGDDESSTDDNFDMFGQGTNKTNPKMSPHMNLPMNTANPLSILLRIQWRIEGLLW